MTEYIDRAEAIKAVCRKCTACSVLTDKDDKAFSKAHCAEIRALQELPSAPGWISVKDRLPEADELYLTCYKFRGGGKQYLDVLRYYATLPDPHFQNERYDGMTVTHWMPLPEPTKED